MKAWVRIPILLVGLLLIALPTSAQQPRSLAELSIISEQITSTDEGRVSVDFVVRGSDGFGVFDLTAGSVQLSEPADQVTLTETPRLNLTVGFIVDLSAGSNAPLIRETLRAWFRTFYREGDPVTLYILDGDTRQPRIVAIEDANQARDVINGLRTAPIFHRLEDTLPRVLSDMRAVGDAPTRPRHVVYVGSFLTAPREVNDAAAFAELGVPLHVIQVHRNRPTDTLEQFAENGRGLFVDNEDGALVLADGEFTPINRLRLLYEVIDSSRLVHTLTYRTRSQSLDTTRTVDLTVTLPDDITLTAAFTYDWNIQPPEVRFVNLTQLSASRTPFRPNNDAAIAYDETAQPVTIAVDFPGGVPRTITTARLEVTATDSGEVQQSTLSDVQPGVDGRFTLDWSLTPFDTPGRTVPVTFTVTVEDELGFTTSATESGSVTVASVPPLPSPTFAPTTDPTAVAQLTREARAQDLGAALILGGSAQQTNDGGGGIGTGTLFTLIGVIVVLVILVVLAVSRMLRLYRLAKEDALQPPTPDPTSVIDEDLAQPAIPADEMETPPEPEPIPQPDPNAGVLARLVIEQGHEHEDLEEQLTSRVFEVRDEEYIIGRSPDDTIGLTLPLPFISPQHCRLLYEDNRFYVRDMGSKNGTFVNGERVPFGQSETVPFGSEIGVSRRVILTLHAPDEELEEDDYLPVEHAQGSQGSRSELEFEPLPGIQPVGDETPPPEDDYSPL